MAELIREQVLLRTGQEVPYATTVMIEQYEEGAKLTRIAATIYCEREGQKAILIGKQGASLKKIGTAARLQIEKVLNTKVFLELFVKVRVGMARFADRSLRRPTGARNWSASRQAQSGEEPKRKNEIPVLSGTRHYSFTAIPSAFILRYMWLRSRPSTSAVRLTLPWFSSSFFRM